MYAEQMHETKRSVFLEKIGEKVEPIFNQLYRFGKKFPTAYKIFVKIIPIFLTLILNILGVVNEILDYLSVVSLLVTYFLIYADAKSQVQDAKNVLTREREEFLSKHQNTLSITVKHTHLFMHHVRDLMATTNSTLENEYRYLDFFGQIVRGVEDTLTQFYNQQISASIKIVTVKSNTKQKEIATLKRGPNNCASRSSIGEIDLNTSKAYKHVTNANANYAYRSIVKNGNRCYVCGNLSDFKQGKTKFFCEYSNSWEKLFNATIIIPIRGLKSTSKENNESLHYLTRGLLCVDAVCSIDEWNCSNEREMDALYAYNFCATVADMLFPIISKWVEELEEANLCKHEKRK